MNPPPAGKRRTMNTEFQNTKYEIRNTHDENGFSLMEVLLAVGTLAIGMLFIAGVFPVSIHFTTVASERTIAATVADEAFAKCKIYIDDPNLNDLFSNRHKVLAGLPANEFAYPSTPTTEPYSKKYWWSVICRKVGPDSDEVQVTVFVSRKVGTAGQYLTDPDPNYPMYYDANRPDPVTVQVSGTTGGYELTITDGRKTYINAGCTIVDDATGQIYRVLERYRDNPATPAVDESQIIHLDRSWQAPPTAPPYYVWVVSPPVGGGRYPCIAVYQKVIRF
jgi:hypothetical protein